MPKTRSKRKNSQRRPVSRPAKPDRSRRRRAPKIHHPKNSSTTASDTSSSTKRDRILTMLRSSSGASLATLAEETQWQPHSVRGFLAGVVRKKLGLDLVSTPTDQGRIYRIVDKTEVG
ncbi:MAG: DUF3489 domain-containing protein [Pseudolabrys sp.]|nr:DUF3489 domain-containing protein [Pseudolabrys sp.]